MQHVSDQHYRRPGMGSLTRYAAVFTGWRRLCMLTALLCGVATLAAADTHESGVSPAPVLGDLNGDGRDDVMLRHTDGRWFYYPMDGRSHITDQRGYADLTRNLAWQFAGIGDLNGDGRDDVLMRHTDGRWWYYPMDGRRHITAERGLAGLTRNLDWHVAGIGDLNGDGKDDVLLRNKNGRWYYYPMNGRRYLTDERGYADLTRDLDWQVAGMGDLNGDGKDDVLLRHTDGRWDYYPMDGRNPIADQRGLAGLTRNLAWSVAGIGDLNGDGRDDVLLRHTDSRWYYYPMNGRRFLIDERGYAGLTRNLAWQVAGIGDLNGDGRDDVLLRHTDSRWYYYPMDGRNYLADERGYANLTRNPDWSITDTDTLTPEDTAPSFGTAGVADQNYVTGAAIDALTLPAAGGGNGALTYSLTPDVPGLSFDAATRRLTGTPTSVGTYNMTYTVTDEDGDTDTLSFAITVNPDSSGTSTISRTEFEASAPTGYTSVTLGDSGSVWGVPVKYTSDSNSGTVAYMLLGTMKGCTFANAEADRSSRAYIKTQELGSLSNYESAIVCRKTSSTWNSFAGTRMTHLRVFDESSPTNIREYVYDAATGLYDETTSPAPEPVGFAPADQSSFDALAVGKRIVGNDPAYYTEFVSAGRFREVEDRVTYTGRYTYENTGPNAATVEFHYDDGDRCTSTITFDSATAGTLTYSCNDGERGTSSWRIVENPATDNTDQGAPDLVVESPSVSDSTLNTGASFTLRATVRNRGAGRSDATTLRYYRSSNSTISSSDTPAGTDAVSGLAASGSSSELINLTAPSSAGTWYYGACVESVSGESDTGNNCSSGVSVTVSVSGGGGGGGGSLGQCSVGLVVNPGESCTHPVNGEIFSVDSSGRGHFMFATAGRSISISANNVTFAASRNSDDSWTIERLG